MGGRLRLLIEAESLPNDGTAAVAYVAALGFLAGGPPDFLAVAGTLLLTIVGGALIGAVVASGFTLLAGGTRDYLVEITFTTLAAYGSCFMAEHFHTSGVLAALTAGLVAGNFRSSALIIDTDRQLWKRTGSSDTTSRRCCVAISSLDIWQLGVVADGDCAACSSRASFRLRPGRFLHHGGRGLGAAHAPSRSGRA